MATRNSSRNANKITITSSSSPPSSKQEQRSKHENQELADSKISDLQDYLTDRKVNNVTISIKIKGSPLHVNNYRPISLLSNIDKTFEKLVKKRFFFHF